ncbi:MAG: terminase family protein, partial [Phycisphaerales bacterium]
MRHLKYRWDDFWARPNQLEPPGHWSTWMVKAGRGFGKTRVGAETLRKRARRCRRMALVAPTAADARDTMVEGESGILAVSPPWFRPKYEPSKRRLTWPNGSTATIYTADEPDRLRGPNVSFVWADELAAWRYGPEAWAQVDMILRLEDEVSGPPQCVVTTTPRPTKLVRDILADSGTSVTHGSTYDNAANLSAAFLARIRRRYEGTRQGDQELLGLILEDVVGALWRQAQLDELRKSICPVDLARIVVAVDPAVTATNDSDETGIVVCGLGSDGHLYVVDDLSGRYSPGDWASIVLDAYDGRRADAIVVEVNNGGDLVEHTIRTSLKRGCTMPRVIEVRASRGKYTRAEPIAALYEQKRAHHIGSFRDLESQM